MGMGMRGGGLKGLMEEPVMMALLDGSAISLGLHTTCWDDEHGSGRSSGLPFVG